MIFTGTFCTGYCFSVFCWNCIGLLAAAGICCFGSNIYLYPKRLSHYPAWRPTQLQDCEVMRINYRMKTQLCKRRPTAPNNPPQIAIIRKICVQDRPIALVYRRKVLSQTYYFHRCSWSRCRVHRICAGSTEEMRRSLQRSHPKELDRSGKYSYHVRWFGT